MALTRDTLARRIREALRLTGISQVELAGATEMDPTALNKALAGRRDFKSLEVALIAERLGISTDALLADDGADLALMPAMAARIQTDSTPAVGIAIDRARQLQDLDALLGDLGYLDVSILTFPPIQAASDPIAQGEALAEAMRRKAGIGSEDLPGEPEELAGWLEGALGLNVCITPLPVGLDGLALNSNRLRLALISSGISATRQRFTLAHEVCHLASGDAHDLTVDEDVFGRRTSEERRANAFAAAFLMPSEAMRAATTGKDINEDLIVSLLGRFRVSLDALAFRMHNTRIVDAAGRDRIRAMSSARIALRPGRANDLQARNERRAPGRLLARAIKAFAIGDLGIRPLASLLDTDPSRLLDELSPPRFAALTSGDAQEPVYAL